jgi:hypothetical protein
MTIGNDEGKEGTLENLSLQKTGKTYERIRVGE